MGVEETGDRSIATSRGGKLWRTRRFGNDFVARMSTVRRVVLRSKCSLRVHGTVEGWSDDFMRDTSRYTLVPTLARSNVLAGVIGNTQEPVPVIGIGIMNFSRKRFSP